MVSETRRDGAPEPTRAHILIVEARFYDDLADELLQGAQSWLEGAGATFLRVTVPGALEIPAAAAIALDIAEQEGRPFDGVVALGSVIRGETFHFEIVAGESSRALMDLSVSRRIPVGNGILTVENQEQAWTRARVSEGNKGAGAAEAVLSLIRMRRGFAARVQES